MRRLVMLLIFLILFLFTRVIPVCGDAVSVFANGNLVGLDPPAIVHSNEVYVETSDFFAMLGIQLNWDSKNEAFISSYPQSLSLSFKPREGIVKVNDSSYKLDNLPLFLRKYTYVPVKDLADIFNYSVSLQNDSLILTGDFILRNFEKYVPHYKIEAIYSGDKIYGEEEVIYTNTQNRDLRSLFFMLPAAAVNPQSSIKVYSVMVDGQPVEYEAKETYLNIVLPHVLEPLEKCRISISFDTFVPEGPKRLGRWEGLSLLSCWYPAIPINRSVPIHSGFGEPYSFQAATYELNFKVSREVQVLSGLQKLGNTTLKGDIIYNFVSQKPIREATLAVGNFKTKVQKVGNVTLCYAYKDSEANILGYAADALRLFQKWWGDYPYRTLTLVDVPLDDFHGMEYGAILFFSTINRPDPFTVVHEVAHQWWYGIVGNDQDSEAWIDEGLANYSAMLYFEERGGYNEYLSHVKALEKKCRGVREPFKRSLSKFENERDYRINAYVRGALFWHDIRAEIGRENLIKFLANVQRYYRYGYLTGEEIQFMLEMTHLEIFT